MFNSTEDKYRPAYDAWQEDQSPEGNAAFLKAVDPIVQKGLKMYGGDSPLTASRARLVALEAARKYDPTRSRLQSHMLNQMQSLRRIQRKQQEVIRVPERVLLERRRLQDYEQEFSDELGRDPSDAELSDRLGVSLKRLARIRQYQPGMNTGQAGAVNPEQGMPASFVPGQQAEEDHWTEIVYMDLGNVDQKIMELSLGMHGRKRLSNKEIAAKLNRTPGAITQRKKKIQALLDQEQDLSPFIPTE